MDAAEFVGLDSPTGVTATTDVDAALAACDAVAYMASGDIRPDEAVDDIERCLRAGKHVVTPSLYSLYDPRSAPPEWVERLTAAAEEGGSTLLVSGVDPGWGNDALAVTPPACAPASEPSPVRRSSTTRPTTSRSRSRCRVGSAAPWTRSSDDAAADDSHDGVGRQRPAHRPRSRLEIDEITEEVERLPLDRDGRHRDGPFEKGTQGAFWLKVIGWSGGTQRVVIEHITRIHPSCAPDWPYPDEGVGDHRVIVDGDPAADDHHPRRRARRHPRRRRQHDRRQPAARRHQWLADAEAGHLRRTGGAACTRRCPPRWKPNAGPTESAKIRRDCSQTRRPYATERSPHGWVPRWS